MKLQKTTLGLVAKPFGSYPIWDIFRKVVDVPDQLRDMSRSCIKVPGPPGWTTKGDKGHAYTHISIIRLWHHTLHLSIASIILVKALKAINATFKKKRHIWLCNSIIN